MNRGPTPFSTRQAVKRALGACAAVAILLVSMPALGHEDLLGAPPVAPPARPATDASDLAAPEHASAPLATPVHPSGLGGTYITYAKPPQRMGSADGPGATEDLEFVCPEPPLGLPIDPTVRNDDVIVYGCPIRIHDARYSLGNGAIAIDHNEHRQVVFNSLHGGASDGEPYDHARGGTRGQVHTTFASGDQGIQWQDQPPSQRQEPSNRARGSDNDLVMDSNGQIYAGYLYHIENGDGDWQSLTGLYKAGQPSEYDMSASYDRVYWLETRDPGNRVHRIDLMHLPGHLPIRDLGIPTNETAPSAGDEEFGETTVDYDYANETQERIVTIWHETAKDVYNATTGLSGWIDVAWTEPSAQNSWQRLYPTAVVGPCSAGSNGVQHHGKIYVACVVDKGYNDRNRARVGDVDLWEIDVHRNTTTLVGFTGITTRGEVLLAQANRDDNTYLGLLAWEPVMADNETLTRLEIRTAYSWLSSMMRPGGRMAESALDLGIQLRAWGRGGEDVPLNDAHITAFEMTDDTYQSILVYSEWHDDPQLIPTPDINADATTPIRTRLTDYTKYFMAFNECDGPVAGYQADLGSSVDQYNSEQYAENPGIFNEPRDGLFKTREAGTGEELLYFALGDYGAIQYGAVLVNAMSSLCTPPPIPPFIAQAVAPQALTVSSGASALMAAGFAVPATLMIGYMLSVKRRNPLASAAGDDL